jgi:prolyl-tRNA editing enzyme YbaK/EbsC (Cys-tRNA(Pro) deacylase)
MTLQRQRDGESSLLTPADLADFIVREDIAAELVPMAVETPTVPDAAAALGVAPAQIIKSLLFLVREQPVLVIACGDTMVDRRVLGERFGLGKKQIKLADAETVLALLGYPVGGVPPFGHVKQAPVLLDRAAQGWEVVYGGGGDDHTLLRIAPDELARVTRAEWIDLEAGKVHSWPG